MTEGKLDNFRTQVKAHNVFRTASGIENLTLDEMLTEPDAQGVRVVKLHPFDDAESYPTALIEAADPLIARILKEEQVIITTPRAVYTPVNTLD